MTACDPASFLNATKLPCGQALRFADADDAAQCCAACAGTDGCTHWVFNPEEAAHRRKPCHVKGGGGQCPAREDGATSGYVGGPGPGPAPPSPAGETCTNEYSTDLWGQLAVQALAAHDPATPLYVKYPGHRRCVDY